MTSHSSPKLTRGTDARIINEVDSRTLPLNRNRVWFSRALVRLGRRKLRLVSAISLGNNEYEKLAMAFSFGQRRSPVITIALGTYFDKLLIGDEFFLRTGLSGLVGRFRV